MTDDETSALARTRGAELAPLEVSNLPDAYERDYMSGAGKVLARHRMVAGWKFNGMMAPMAPNSRKFWGIEAGVGQGSFED